MFNSIRESYKIAYRLARQGEPLLNCYDRPLDFGAIDAAYASFARKDLLPRLVVANQQAVAAYQHRTRKSTPSRRAVAEAFHVWHRYYVGEGA